MAWIKVYSRTENMELLPNPEPNPNTRTIHWKLFPLLTLKSSSTTSHTLKPHLQLNQNQTQSPLRHTPWDFAIATFTAFFNPLHLLYAECSLFGCFRKFFLRFYALFCLSTTIPTTHPVIITFSSNPTPIHVLTIAIIVFSTAKKKQTCFFAP